MRKLRGGRLKEPKEKKPKAEKKDDGIDAHYKKQEQQKMTQEVENLLIGGMAPADIKEHLGERLQRSVAWIYVIKTRLKNEGKLQV